MRSGGDSKGGDGVAAGPSVVTIAGMRWFAVIFRNSGLNWSPAPILTGITLYSRPSSSSAMCTLWPLGVGQLHTSIIAQFSRCVRRARAILGSAEVERNADEPAPANPL